MGDLGFSEVILVLVITLMFFGAGRIADVGRGLGEGVRNFKKGLREDGDK